MTSGLLTALKTIPEAERPLFLPVSGLDDLAPDGRGNVDDRSAVSTQLSGFAHIGVPVRRLIEASGVASTYGYLGTVYGPGKSFAASVFPKLASGSLRLPGKADNRMGIVHVEDAARALVHIAQLDRDRSSGNSFVIADGHPVAMADFMGFAAELLGGPRPKRAPLWLVGAISGGVLFETLTRDIAAHPTALIETGFEFRYRSYRDGLPPSIEQLHFQRPKPKASLLDRPAIFLAIAVLTAGAFLAENFLSFPLSVPYMKSLAGGAPILDMRPGYTPAAVYQLFDALGAVGRSAYLKLLWSLDVLLPALFGLFLSAAMRRGALRKWSWVPFVGSAFDYAENIAITALLLQYPVQLPALAYVAATFTVVKLAFYATGVALSVGGLLWRTFKTSGSAELSKVGRFSTAL
jgi:hypothetical protein